MPSPSKSTPAARPGRRRGGTSTRQAVLDAARARFASDGFAGATIRRIATDAGVDASQVIQFFGSKDELFAAVMDIPHSALERFDIAFEGPGEDLGERVVRAFLAAWEGDIAESGPLMAMLRAAMVNDQANQQLRDFIQSRLLNGADVRRGDDAALRSGLVAAMLVGVITSRRIIGVPVLAEAETDDVVAIAAPAIHQILTGEGPPRTAQGPR